MYDPLETEISRQELMIILDKCNKRNIPICVIGGWASYFYVNEEYRRAFGKDYMGSRDMDVFFDPKKEEEFAKLIYELGFEKNGFKFRYEKIYNRETKKFIKQCEAKLEALFNLIYICLDLFSNKETKAIQSWNDLEPLKKVIFYKIENVNLADIDTLVALKCVALFARDKTDKENKDACDLYALLQYSKKKIMLSLLLKPAIEKILKRSDLLYFIAQNVLLDSAKQSIVEVTLKSNLKELEKKGYLETI